MLPSDCISKLLDVEHLEITNIEHKEREIVLEVRMKRRAYRCPACGAVTEQVHDYRVQRVKDSPYTEAGVGFTARGGIAVPAAGSGFTKATISCPNGTGSQTGWRRNASGCWG